MNSSDEHRQAAAAITARCAIVTLSDTRGVADDKSGQTIIDRLTHAGHWIEDYVVLKDDAAPLEAHLKHLLNHPRIDAIFTNGGTGISQRDSTIAVVDRLLDQPLPGFGELFRMLSFQQVGSAAMLSRATGGVAKSKLLFALPGSSKAVELAMDKLLLPELKHLIFELRKGPAR